MESVEERNENKPKGGDDWRVERRVVKSNSDHMIDNSLPYAIDSIINFNLEL